VSDGEGAGFPAGNIAYCHLQYHTIGDDNRGSGDFGRGIGGGVRRRRPSVHGATCCGRAHGVFIPDADLAENGLEVNPVPLGRIAVFAGGLQQSREKRAKKGNPVMLVERQTRSPGTEPSSWFGIELAAVPICVGLSGNGRYVL
jgi:hypothetical protein